MDPDTLQALNTIVPGISPWVVVGGALVGVLGPMTVTACSIIAAVLPDGSKAMKLTNAVALNVGKAKNDPGVQ